MTAFWRETRPYFNRGELDAAERFCSEVQQLCHFEGLEVYLRL